MKFRTEIPFSAKSKNQIDYFSKVFLLGSCFTENIGEKFEYAKFQTIKNPFGIIFHPVGIENIISKAIQNYSFSNNDTLYHNSCWHSFDAHSYLSNPEENVILSNLNNALSVTKKRIETLSHIIITLGTAWVYKYLKTKKIVSNCHKIPQKEFHKELLSVHQISKSLSTILSLVKKVNPKATVIFTVSPVRHLKDGFVENTQSKAHLVTAIHETISKFSNAFYFPAYEIMIDELRDYRFYKEDMIHPNATAINYIWEKFTAAWISKEAFPTLEKVVNVQKGLQHKPFDSNSKAHQQFLIKLKEQQKQLKKAFSHITF